jgi:BirA family biotin operon repressor/biotin-[acetyl-CoA-carboxylase] ligase
LPDTFRRQPVGAALIELQSVDSTNNYARGLISSVGMPERNLRDLHGTTILAKEQTAGKGQMGKSWEAEKDANILMSIIVVPHSTQLTRQFELSACVAVSLHKFFATHAGDETKIKWPNDLYWNDRKTGGVLIESGIKDGQWIWSIIGMGININQTVFPDNLPNPVSLTQVTGLRYNVPDLATQLCSSLEYNFQQLSNNAFDDIFSYYNQNLYGAGKKVRLKKQNRIFDAVIKNVSKDGRLIVECGVEESFSFGEVEFVI